MQMGTSLERLEHSVKVAWGNVALWKHRYHREKKKREALEEAKTQVCPTKEIVHLKKHLATALETCSIKDEEIDRTRKNLEGLINDVEKITRLTSERTKKQANIKIVQLLQQQMDLESEISMLRIKSERQNAELLKLRSICAEYASTHPVTAVDSQRNTSFSEERYTTTLRQKSEIGAAYAEVDRIKQELAMKELSLKSYQEKLAQSRKHCRQQEELVVARTADLEACRCRELELRRSFAQRLQSLEMMLNTSQCAFASRERELLQKLTVTAAGHQR